MKKLLFIVFILVASVTPFSSASALDGNVIPGLKDQYNPAENSNPFNSDLVGEVSDGLPGQVSTFDTAKSPLERVNEIIQVLLSFLGIGALGLMVYAGFRWMTSAGNDDAVTDAKKTMRNAVIGFIIIISSYALTTFIARRIQREAGGFGVGGGLFSGSATIGDGIEGSFGTGVDSN